MFVEINITFLEIVPDIALLLNLSILSRKEFLNQKWIKKNF